MSEANGCHDKTFDGPVTISDTGLADDDDDDLHNSICQVRWHLEEDGVARVYASHYFHRSLARTRAGLRSLRISASQAVSLQHPGRCRLMAS
jgi:hypothetical protein